MLGPPTGSATRSAAIEKPQGNISGRTTRPAPAAFAAPSQGRMRR